MSWRLGGSKKAAPPSPVPAGGASTPTQRSSSNAPHTSAPSSGVLMIRVVAAKGLALPPGVNLPSSIQQALAQRQAQVANGRGSVRESLQRKQMWWLPYIVLEFDKNEILVDALGGDLDNPVWHYRASFDVSRASEISLSAYLRTAPSVPGQERADMGNDLFLAGVKFAPTFDSQQASEHWYNATLGSGAFQIQVGYQPAQNSQSLTIEDFELLKVIGKGSFGKVMQVRKKDTGRIYALKTIRKAHIVSRHEVTHTLAERTVLGQVTNPFIVGLKFSFQTADKLYLGLPYTNGGELFHHLQNEGRFSEQRSRFYAAELLCALEHLHSFHVIYRDLKPENILLDYNGHIALCDFGLCKLNMSESDRTNTFCGTPEYLAPEILLAKGYGVQVDWWTLGVLLYEMLAGLPPYYDENHEIMYKKILQEPLRFPSDMGSDARDILRGLLTRDPAQRLGVNGAEEIKRHPFFAKHVDWRLLLAKKIQPPFKPSVNSAIDCSNFDTEFTSEAPQDSVVEGSNLSQSVQALFEGFTYKGPSHLGESVAVGSEHLHDNHRMM